MKTTKLKLKVEVSTVFPLTKEELYTELLLAENKMNTESKLRFHILPPKENPSVYINPVFKKITKKWFKEKFVEITQEEMNGEEAEDIEFVYLKKSLTINFNLNLHRYGFSKGLSVRITDGGEIYVDLNDTSLEGCGVDDILADAIYDLMCESGLKKKAIK